MQYNQRIQLSCIFVLMKRPMQVSREITRPFTTAEVLDGRFTMNRSIWEVDFAFTALNGVAGLVCLLVAILVLALKLHKTLVYRLALYQVLSALAFATVEAFQIIFISYDISTVVYGQTCNTIGWLSFYTRWAKLLFTMWVTFHLFCFALLQKNLKKLEVLYVVTSLLVPAPIASVPLVTRTYGVSSFHSYCYIYSHNGNPHLLDLTERLVLWDVPAMVILMISSAAMVIIIITIAKRLCQKMEYEPITKGDTFWKALKELLPLAAFPIFFFIFQVPGLMYDLFSGKVEREAALGTPVMCTSLWSLSSGVTLIIHLLVMACIHRGRRRNRLPY